MNMRPSNFQINPSHPLYDSLLFFAPGRIATNTLLYDESPFAYHQSWVGAPTLDYGLGRRTTVLNGTSQWCDLLTLESKLDYTAFSASIWWNATTTTGNRFLFGTVSSNTFKMYPLNGGFFRMQVGDSSLWQPTFAANTWNHASVSYDGTNGTAWFNGVKGIDAAVTTAAANNFSIGSFAALYDWFSGSIADVIVWNRPLADSEHGILRSPDPMIHGLIQPRVRKWWPVVSAAPPAAAANAHIIGGGIVA